MCTKRDRPQPQGMTLVEILVVAVIIAILAGLLLTSALKSRNLMRAAQCLSNQRQIGLALQLYWESKEHLPDDSIGDCLRTSLLPIVSDAGLFRCPTHRQTDADSYSPWYVQRPVLQDSNEYVAGCFRHPERTPILYGDLHVAFVQPEKILCNGIAVFPGAEVAERSIDSGQMAFGDGSGVQVKKSKKGNAAVEGLASFRRSDGVLCSLVRIKGEVEVEIAVTPGSGFEAITTPLTARVRGTAFTVETEESDEEFAAEVKVTSGRVDVAERKAGGKGHGQELAPGQSKKITKPKK